VGRSAKNDVMINFELFVHLVVRKLYGLETNKTNAKWDALDFARRNDWRRAQTRFHEPRPFFVLVHAEPRAFYWNFEISTRIVLSPKFGVYPEKFLSIRALDLLILNCLI
jgi:hypothetical protein